MLLLINYMLPECLLHQGCPKCGLGAISGLWNHFVWPCENATNLNLHNNLILYKFTLSLIENVGHKEFFFY